MAQVELIRSRASFSLHISGFLYYKNGGAIGARAYWLCKKSPECNARATTIGGVEDIRLVRGDIKDHTCIPDPDTVQAERVVARLKRCSGPIA